MASILKVDTLQTPAGTAPTAADLGLDIAGSTLQVQQDSILGSLDASKDPSGREVTLSVASGYITIMQKSITTTKANSAIRVDVNCIGYCPDAPLRCRTVVQRDLPTALNIIQDSYGYYAPITTMQNYVCSVIDYPNVSAGTTLTYTFTVYNSGTSNATYISYSDGGGGSTDSLILTEIAQ